MASPETFVSELEGRNQTSFERLTGQLAEIIDQAPLSISDLLQLEARGAIEAAENCALWLTETESLTFKLSLAGYCGACAQRYAAIADRLGALGIPLGPFDPLAMGYSKMFAHLRSLQTTPERTAAGAITAGSYAIARWAMLAGRAETAGDVETARLFSITLPDTEREYIHETRRELLESARNEETQARARRAAFRAIELLAEVQDAGLFKRFLSRSLKPQSPA